MKPLPTEQVHTACQVMLTVLSDEGISTPNNMLEGVVSGKSLLRGILTGQLAVCSSNQPEEKVAEVTDKPSPEEV